MSFLRKAVKKASKTFKKVAAIPLGGQKIVGSAVDAAKKIATKAGPLGAIGAMAFGPVGQGYRAGMDPKRYAIEAAGAAAAGVGIAHALPAFSAKVSTGVAGIGTAAKDQVRQAIEKTMVDRMKSSSNPQRAKELLDNQLPLRERVYAFADKLYGRT